VFSHIYLDNLKPARLVGYLTEAAKNALAVDNFFVVFSLLKSIGYPRNHGNCDFS